MLDKTSILFRINRLFSMPRKKRRIGLDYIEHRVNDAKEQIEYFSKYVDLIGKNILEIGCGVGGLVLGLSEKNEKINIGLEKGIQDEIKNCINPIMQNVANNLLYISGDACHLPFRKGNFDIVFSMQVLEHLKDVEESFDEIFQILKPNGYYCFEFMPYYTKRGHHLTDFIRIPWAHVFLSNKAMIEVSAKMLQYMPNYYKNIPLRTVEEQDEFLNKLTIAKLETIINKNKWKIVHRELCESSGWYFKPFTHISAVRELFVKNAIFVLKKVGSS